MRSAITITSSVLFVLVAACGGEMDTTRIASERYAVAPPLPCLTPPCPPVLKTPVCGDGVLDEPEDCEGADIGGMTCLDLGFSGGSLACKSGGCAFDLSDCVGGCGNSRREGAELCDGTDLGGKTCAALGYDGGKVSCNANCTFKTLACYRCGDRTKNGAEQCDGTAGLATASCVKLGFSGGTVSCSSSCTYSTAGCYTCGDGVISSAKGEQCEGTNLAGKTCASLGYAHGSLACSSSTCTFSTSGCYTCGDGKVSGSEVCDGTSLAGKTCASFGYTGGTLACKSSCGDFDTSKCYSVCGNGKKETGEQCDGSQVTSCTSLGYTGGTLSCSQCKWNASSCTTSATSATSISVGNTYDFQITADGLVDWLNDQTYNSLTCDRLGEPADSVWVFGFGDMIIPAGACHECGRLAGACANACYAAGYITAEWRAHQAEECRRDPQCFYQYDGPTSSSGSTGGVSDKFPSNPPSDIPVVDFQRCLAEQPYAFAACWQYKPYCKKCGECRPKGCGFWDWLGCIVQGAGCAVSVIGGGVGAVTCPVITAYVCGPCF